ncbi:ABC transporter substrate-binding protein [Pseudarthrobacter sp. P1]|uniref:ABC transporter substrate-binding protein n=1 Tax=Pseudarthrobacter sp. P1 TaxID=3418418 RepID=UPI003CEADD3E
MTKWIPARAVAAALALSAPLLAACTATTPPPAPISSTATPATTAAVPLVVGGGIVPDHANPGEGAVLAELYAGALNAAGIPATTAAASASRTAAIGALETAAVDVVPDYAASLLAQLDPASIVSTADVPKAVAAKLPAGLAALDAAKAADSDALVVTKVTAQKYSLKTIEDLAKVCGQIAIGASADFATRPDGLPALRARYDCNPLSFSTLESTGGALVVALLRDNVLAADIHTSSPAISQNDLVVLDDNKKAWREDHVLPLVNAAAVQQPARDVLNKVSGMLTTEDLIALNRLMAGSQAVGPAQAAAQWLVDKGLAKKQG